jgi:hypothetical protein
VSRYHFVNKLYVDRIEVLIFVDDELLKVDQAYRVQVPGHDLAEALAHHFAGKYTGVGLAPRAVKRDERGSLLGAYGRGRRDIVGGRPLSRAPKRFMLASDLLASFFSHLLSLPEFRIKDFFQFEVV